MGIETAKRLACENAVKKYLQPLLNVTTNHTKPSIVIGIGSGSTIVHCVNEIRTLHQQLGSQSLIKACIPTSFQARQLIIENNLPLGDLNQYPNIDVTFDGADEVDFHLNLIKGGGGCHFLEKMVAAASKTMIVVADDRKIATHLGTQWTKGVPLEVSPLNYIAVDISIRNIFPGSNPVLRTGSGKAGPVITDSGNVILDVHFSSPIKDPSAVHRSLLLIPGVIESGLFCGMAKAAFFGTAEGKVFIQNDDGKGPIELL